jgi:hypothetical protein
MVLAVKLLEGLRPYGPLATAFPAEWGRLGREGTVVEFKTAAGTWVGNFRRGLGGLELAHIHPNKRDAVVVAAGDLWVVDAVQRSAELVLPAIDAALEVQDPDGWIFSRQCLALARFGPEGLVWHTKRLSWDGFDQISIRQGEITGLAWSPMDEEWYPFQVDLFTGRSTGGSFPDDDAEGWERLADDARNIQPG